MCYTAGAYQACCAMVGAATESALLRVAIEKDGDEEAVIREYRSASGRRKLENLAPARRGPKPGKWI